MKKNFYYLSLLLGLFFGMTMFTACGGDDGDGGGGDDPANNEIVRKLMAKRWHTSSSDYNEYSYGAAVETSRDYFYFLDGQHGVNVYRTKEVDSYFGTSRKEGKMFFNYYVQGNSVIINYFNNGGSQTLTFNESYLDSGGNIYSGIDLTSDDQNMMSTLRTELAEALDASGYEAAVKSGVLANIKKTDNFHRQLDITSNLGQKYPNKTIKYVVVVDTNVPGARYGNGYEEYSFNDNNNLHVDNLLSLNANTSIFLKIYDSIKAKQNSGQSLTSEEREALKDYTDILNEIANYTTFEFFVEINGQRFSIPTKYI